MGHVIQLQSATKETPGWPPFEALDPAIRTDTVYVVYTSLEETLAAVGVAGDFATALGVPVTLVHVRTVPYVLPLDEPAGVSPVETDAFMTRLRAEGFDVRVRVHLCRDEGRAIPQAFNAHSMVVVAGRRRWWRTASERWRRRLEAAGHFVVFVDMSRESARGYAEPRTCESEARHQRQFAAGVGPRRP